MKNILTIVFITTLLISCGKKNQETNLDALNKQKATLVHQLDSLTTILNDVEANITKLDTAQKITFVTALPVKNEVFKHYVEIQGVVQTDKNIEIHPELGGNVMAIYVKEGQQVNAGQTIMQLDDATIQNNISQIKTQLTLATTTFERQQRLWNQKIGSEIQFLQAKTQKESLEDNLNSLKTQAKKMKITAPFSGVIDEIFPRVGELTNPLNPLVRLVNLNNMYVEAEVTEAYLSILKVGAPVIVNFPSIKLTVDSKISQIANYINPNNRSFKIKIAIPNKNNAIKPNLLVDLKILDFEQLGTVIPSTLVQQDIKGDRFIYALKTENQQKIVVRKEITSGKEYNHEIFITKGLTATDTIVNEGARIVKDGEIVKISNTNF